MKLELPSIYDTLKRISYLNDGDTTYFKYLPTGEVFPIKINKIEKQNNFVIITHKDGDNQITNKYDRLNGCMEDMNDIVLYALTKQEYEVYLEKQERIKRKKELYKKVSNFKNYSKLTYEELSKISDIIDQLEKRDKEENSNVEFSAVN